MNSFHTEPTYVSSTTAAGHVIATVDLLNRTAAFRTVFDVVVHLPFLEAEISASHRVFVIFTCRALMIDHATFRTNHGQACRTTYHLAGSGCAIDVRAVRRRTVWKLGRMASKLQGEG